jgi:hypothetical protein
LGAVVLVLVSAMLLLARGINISLPESAIAEIRV